MAAATYELEIAWPITSHTAPLDQLKAEARADLYATLAARGLTRAGHTLIAVTHGTRPAIIARLLVTGPAGLAGRIEATQAPIAEGAAA